MAVSIQDMSLKRKIRFSNLTGSSQEASTSGGGGGSDAFPDESTKSSEDPFAFPTASGGTNSETSSLASDGTNQPKKARLVLKLGSSKKAAAPAADNLIFPALPGPLVTPAASGESHESPAKRSPAARRKDNRRKKPKNRADEISVQVKFVTFVFQFKL